jgi:hypothetical protein
MRGLHERTCALALDCAERAEADSGEQKIVLWRLRVNRATLVTAIAFITMGAGCVGSPSGPSSSAIVTFSVVDERFRVVLTGDEQVAAARAAQGGGPARIPVGRIVPGTQANTGWNWHLEDVAFTESTIELCDGRPSDVQRQGIGFGGGRYCPWGATSVGIDPR